MTMGTSARRLVISRPPNCRTMARLIAITSLSSLGVIMALIKSYARSEGAIGSTVHLIENAKNVTYEEGYFINDGVTVLGRRDDKVMVYHDHAGHGNTCRVIDFDNEHGVRNRIYTELAYICNDLGKTTDKLGVESVSPSPLAQIRKPKGVALSESHPTKFGPSAGCNANETQSR